jgi:peptide/nickel transport system substrate-binding protein
MDSLDFGVWLENLQKANFYTSIGWSTSGITPWDFYRNVLDSTLINADTNVADGQLWGRWTTPETDQLLTDFTSTADEAEQKEIVNQLQMAYVENVAAIPLFPGPTWYEYNTTRFVGWPTEENYYAQGSPWETQARLIVLTKIHCVDNTSCGQK